MLKLNNSSLYDAYDWLELFRLSLVKSDSNFDTVDLDPLWNSLNQEIGVCRKNFQTMYISSRCYPFCQNTVMI